MFGYGVLVWKKTKDSLIIGYVVGGFHGRKDPSWITAVETDAGMFFFGTDWKRVVGSELTAEMIEEYT